MDSQIPDTMGPNTQTQTQQIAKVPDATLTGDIQQQLASDPAFAGVQVAAHNCRVELTGSVPTKEDRKKAKEMAKSVPGVTSVKEHLTVGSNL
jgi:osmotically-inducible protein OsmY